jgi:cell division protein FtsB
MEEDLNNERNRLNRIIRDKKDAIEDLNSQIADLVTIRENKSTLENEIQTLTEQKLELDTFISENTTTKTSLSDEIRRLALEKTTLDSYITSNNPVKEKLSEDLEKLQTDNSDLSAENSDLTDSSTQLEIDIKKLKTEKKTLSEATIELREKYGLYSKDMKEMSLDSKSQLLKYSWSAILAIAVTITLMIILLNILTNENPYSDKLMKLFKYQPNFRFYSLLTIRLSISAVFIFFIIIFLNLSRGFISQYIKARNRLTALRVTDFLIERIQTKKHDELSTDDLTNIETERIKEQVELLSDQLPKLMDLGNSSFDKTSKTENPLKILKEVKDLVR